jgi:coenzyme F420-reducing hydrogenase delta subunit/ferredoxin
MADSTTFEPRIVGFLCNWCSYAGADLAGTSRTAYPPNIRIVRVPCSGRVDPLFVARSLEEGADGVLVLGCHPGDCHYSDGNYYTRRRFAVMRELLVFLGVEEERLKLDWVSASEGARFARVVGEFTETLRRLGPAEANPDHAIAVPKAPGPPPFVSDTGPLTAQLRALAKGLLEEKKVEVVLGWEKGTVGYRPLFARNAEEVARLEIDARTLLNLVSYLRNLAGRKTAVVVRPADMRALNVLLHEGQVKREDLFLIGLGGDSGRGPLPASAYDALLGRAPESIDGGMPRFPAVEEIESWPARKRAAFWAAQFESCLRCYACRQACPLCYCAECMAEQLDPAWQSIAIETGEKAFFHVMRAFHQAGRCTGCKACADACPVGIPLGLLNQKVAKDVERLFGGYDTGLDPARPLPFTTFRKDESFTGCRHE